MAFRAPSLFPVLESIGNDDVQRIVPDVLRKVERDAVLGEIFPRFFGFPVKLHDDLVFTKMYAQIRNLLTKEATRQRCSF